MLTNSADIFNLLFRVDFNLVPTAPVIKFTNQSTGPNLAGCKWLFQVKMPNGMTVHTTTGGFDINGVWTDYTIPEALQQPGGNIVWSGAPWQFIVTVIDSANQTFTFSVPKDICRPTGNINGDNYGKAKMDIQTRCVDAKLYFEDKTNYAYRKQISPSLVISKRLTVVYPVDEQGTYPDPFIINDFSNGLVPISFSDPNYQAILESVMQYDLGDSVFVNIRYKVKESFPVQCNVDLCGIICEYEKLVKTAAGGCDREMMEKLLLINAKINIALAGKQQPLCKVDVAKVVEEIKEIGGFKCDCDTGKGIVALTITSNSGGGIADCNAVLTCINTLLNSLDQKCLATNEVWDGLTVGGKLQLIINAATATICGICDGPFDLTNTGITQNGHYNLFWKVSNTGNIFKVEFQRQAPLGAFVMYTGGNVPSFTGSGNWNLDITDAGLVPGEIYNVRVSVQCPNGSYSGYATMQLTWPTACLSPTGLTVNAVASTTANISWSAAAGGVTYKWNVYRLTDDILVSSGTTISLGVIVSGLDHATEYIFSVGTICSQTESDATTDINFTTSA